MSSIETTIPTETFLLPGQQACVSTPWERERLFNAPLPLPPAVVVAPAAGSTLDPEALEADPCAGWEVGACEVIRRLSPGSVRSLLALRHDEKAGSRLVVLKRLEVADDLVQALFDHSRWATTLSHPHLARVFGCEVSDEGTFWVTEFLAGATLGEIAIACKKAGKAVPLGLSLAAVHEAALGLGEMHAVGSAHGLVRDQSVLLTFKGATQLIDLGLRRFVKDPQGVHLAPEQQTLRGQSPDACSDVYSLGALLFECLSGRKFADFKSLSQMVAPSSMNLAISKELDAVVLKALARDRVDRYPTANEFARALKEAAAPFMWRSALRADFVTQLFSNRKRREQVLLAGVDSMRRRTSVAVKAVVAPAPELAAVAPPVPEICQPVVLPAPRPAVAQRAQPRRPRAVVWATMIAAAVLLGAIGTLALTEPDLLGKLALRAAATELTSGVPSLLLGASSTDRVLTIDAPLSVESPAVDLAMRIGHSFEPSLVVSPAAAPVAMAVALPAAPAVDEATAGPAPVAVAAAAPPAHLKPAARKHRRDEAPLPPWLSGGSKRGHGR